MLNEQEYATKQILPELRHAVSETDPGLLYLLRKRALQECIFLSKLDHPNIVQFVGVCVNQESVILVMEYLPTPLNLFLEMYTNIPLSHKYSILYDVCLGLEYLHGCLPPLIHRDLNAKNIMLTAEFKAKLVDIGSARHVGTTKHDGELSPCPGALIGMPPETLIEGAIYYDEKMDIFSMGNVILHVITQKWPFPVEITISENVKEVDDLEVLSRLPYIESMDDVDQLKDIVVKCLQSDPSDRPTATEIVQKFKMFCANTSEVLAGGFNLTKAAHSPLSQKEKVQEDIQAQWIISNLYLSVVQIKNSIKMMKLEEKECNTCRYLLRTILYFVLLGTYHL